MVQDGSKKTPPSPKITHDDVMMLGFRGALRLAVKATIKIQHGPETAKRSVICSMATSEMPKQTEQVTNNNQWWCCCTATL